MNQRDQLKQSIAGLVAAHNHMAERFASEMEFVEGLIEHESGAAKQGRRPAAGFSASKWNALADQAWEIVDKAISGGNLRSFDKAVLAAEEVLAPIARVAKGYTLHCVGHGHIDMNWMWSWPETVHTTNDTFKTMLKLMDEYPDFCYTQSQASVYEIIERYNPEMIDEIRRRVKEGRWEVVASHWVEGEKNIISGESLARHMLYARKYMKELLGLDAEDVATEWTPDTFGHALTIPACETRGGVRRIYMCRGGMGWTKPPIFWYQSPDGSRVLVNYETSWYNDSIGRHNAKAMLAFCTKTGLKDWMNVYGVGDHGGGPTRRDIERCHDMNGWPVYPSFKLTTSGPYFDMLEKHGDKWPVIDRELNFEFPGCYTTQTTIKRNNRLGEIYGVQAEWAGVLGMLAAGMAYPEAAMEKVWRDVCFSHFHDILPGSGVAATRTYNDGMFQRLSATTSMITTNALRAVAAKVQTHCSVQDAQPAVQPENTSLSMGGGPGRDTAMGGVSGAGHTADGPRPYVVFNPTASKRSEVITATIWDPQGCAAADLRKPLSGGDLEARDYVVYTADGKEIPAQIINKGEYWSHKFLDLAFPVEVASLGHTVCVAVEAGNRLANDGPFAGGKKVQGQAKMLSDYSWASPMSVIGMENEFLLVELDSFTGGIKRLVDKTTGKDLADKADPMGVLEFAMERPGSMTAWTIQPTYKKETVKVEAIKVMQSGPWVCSLAAKAKVANSDATITYTLKAGQPWVEITVTTRWVEIGTHSVGIPNLSMKFPMALEAARATYEIPFGSIERQEHSGEEVPGLRWADVNGTQAASGKAKAQPAGCALLNDCKYGHSLDGNTLRLTLIRSSYDPDPIPEVGDHAIRMALVPHGQVLTAAQRTQMGEQFNQPLQVISTDVHQGNLPAKLTAVEVSADNVLLSSVKKAQGSDAVVFRLFETEGKPANVRVTLAAEVFGTVQQATEVDFLERPTEANAAKPAKDGFTVKLTSHAIVSVMVKLTNREE